MARGPDAALHHRPGPLRHRTGARAGPSSRDELSADVLHLRALRRRTDRRAVAGPAAAPRRRSRGVASPAWCSTARGSICRARRSCAPPRRAAAIGAISRLRKKRVLRPPTEGGYGTTLHRDYGGEFDYNLDWKPIGGFPVTFGWIHAIRRGQARLHRGLDVGVPNLILRSDRSVREVTDPAKTDAIQRGDAVLDVEQIARWAGCIGNRTTIVPIADAKHDVFLSVPEPRAGGVPRTGPVAGVVSGRNHRVQQLNPNEGDHRWPTSTSRSSAPVRATRSSTNATPTSASRSASRACSAGPASTSAASRRRCSSTPPRSPKPSRDSARFGVDAHVDGVRWSDIVSRVFGRIDPIALGGENYRRSSPNVEVFASHTRFGPTAARRPLPVAHR